MFGEVDVVQVFILAENRLLREALARILNKKSDIRVVGASAFAPDIVQQIAGCRAPGLALLIPPRLRFPNCAWFLRFVPPCPT